MLSIEGNIVSLSGTRRARVEIDTASGLIAAVAEPLGKADLLLAEELVFPGFIDLHASAREDASHNQDFQEDFSSAGLAAAHGGLTAFADVPANPVPPVDEAGYLAKRELAAKSAAEILLYAGIGPHTAPLRSLVPYQVYLGQSVSGLYFGSLDYLDKVLNSYDGQSVSFVCEDPNVLRAAQSASSFRSQHPPEAEQKAVEAVLEMVRRHNLQGKICLCSTVPSLEKIVEAKRAGLPILTEVSPQHLYFDGSMLTESAELFLRCRPPVRDGKENRLALITALKRGEIDFLVSGHEPHTVEEKRRGAPGLPQLDTYALIAAWLMKEHNFSPAEIARVCSYNPGRFYGQFSDVRYGEISEGYAGSLTILDLSASTTVKPENLQTKCGWSPFEDMVFPGRVAYTIIKGRVFRNSA